MIGRIFIVLGFVSLFTWIPWIVGKVMEWGGFQLCEEKPNWNAGRRKNFQWRFKNGLAFTWAAIATGLVLGLLVYSTISFILGYWWGENPPLEM